MKYTAKDPKTELIRTIVSPETNGVISGEVFTKNVSAITQLVRDFSALSSVSIAILYHARTSLLLV